MTPFIHDLAKILEDRLVEPLSTADDFCRLASAGEPVRRAVSLLEEIPADIGTILFDYDVAIYSYRGPVPKTLRNDATAIAADLEAYRGEDDQEGDVALSLILELDAVVSTVVAAERTGRLPQGTSDTLSTRLEQTLAGVSWRSPVLAQLAEDRWLTVGDDPDFVGAYGWLDVLAEAAPSKARTDAVVKDVAKRERRIDDILDRLSN